MATRGDADGPLKDLLAQSNLPQTEARLMVLRILHDNPDRHMSAERMCAALVRRDATAAISTFKTAIYDLNNAGVLSRVLVPLNANRTQTLYEIADKPRHRHLYCTVCRTIFEVCDAVMEQQIAHQFALAGLKPTNFDLARAGKCLSCSKADLTPR